MYAKNCPIGKLMKLITVPTNPNSIAKGIAGVARTFAIGAIRDNRPKRRTIRGTAEICAEIVIIRASLIPKFGGIFAKYFSICGEISISPITARKLS